MEKAKDKERLNSAIKEEMSIIETLEEEEEDVHQLNEQHIKRVEQLIMDYKGGIKSRLTMEQKKNSKWSEKLADKMATFGGSWPFIIIFACFLVVWVVWNTVSFLPHFDEHPFILLNLFLSFLAGFQAPIILMSQNRQAARDKHEAMIDFAINYKAEQENVEMQNQLNRIENILRQLTRDNVSKKEVH